MRRGPRKLRAKYRGKCRACGRDVVPGQLVYWYGRGRTEHADCETARLQGAVCTVCGGDGRLWGAPGRSRPCRSCDGTGSREVQDSVREHAAREYQRRKAAESDNGESVATIMRPNED